MSEVRYSVNGKYFKDFGTYISSSEGLFDALKRKPVNTYDWAEYHGSSPDLSNPKFEQREITLKGFVTGANWEIMKSNFDSIISEFHKAGTQRLLIEPFGLKPLPYEVCMIDEVKLQKEFKNGQMVGTFTLKLIEPNPIKKVLYLTGDALNLAYNSSTETEIFYGNGLKETAKGNVSLSNKTLANRFVSEYAFEGRNFLKNSDFKENINFWAPNSTGEVLAWSSSEKAIDINNGGTGGAFYQPVNYEASQYTVSFDVKPYFQSGTPPWIIRLWVGGNFKDVAIHTSNEYKRYSVVIDVTNAGAGTFVIQALNGDQRLYFKKIKLEKGAVATPYSVAPEEEKFIIIAGNVEEITDLTTNAEVLWDKL